MVCESLCTPMNLTNELQARVLSSCKYARAFPRASSCSHAGISPAHHTAPRWRSAPRFWSLFRSTRSTSRQIQQPGLTLWRHSGRGAALSQGIMYGFPQCLCATLTGERQGRLRKRLAMALTWFQVLDNRAENHVYKVVNGASRA